MTILENDINKLLNDIKLTQSTKEYYYYINLTKNIIYCNDEDSDVVQKKQIILNKQKQQEIHINEELKLFDSLGIPLIGLKGPFIQSEFYGNIPRIYNDLDILVKSKDAKYLYEQLKKYGYKIKYKTFYDNPIFNMKFFPEIYMEHTQTLMLYNKEKDMSIDIHSNLNITNAHFIDTTTHFSTEEFFNNSKKYKDFQNIRQLDIHDNLCYVTRHLLKHHIFYGKTQVGLKTVIQHIMDFATLVNSPYFSEAYFFERVEKYNLFAEAVFCINIYNSIFKNCKKINVEKIKLMFEKTEKSCKWIRVLKATLGMNVSDIMIGNFEAEFPVIYHSVEFCQRIKNKNIDWALQALIINPIVIRYLSKY